MNPYVLFNKQRYPMVWVTFTGAPADDQNFTHYLSELKACYEPQTKLGIVFDASMVSVPALKYQKQQAVWLEDNRELMETYCVGTVYIIPNILIRNVLRAIFAFQTQPVPYKVVSNPLDAEEWMENQLLDL